MAASVLQVLITGDAAGLTKALGEATASAKVMESQTNAATAGAASKLESIGSALKTVAPAFLAVGAVAVGAIAKGIQATQQWASDTRLLQRVTGDSAQSASSLLAATNLLGISTSTLSTSFGTLEKNVVNGSSTLAKYNVVTTDAQGATLPFDDLLGNVIDKFGTLPEGAKQTAFAYAAFGRAGKDLIPILAKGRDGMAELESKAADLGLVMSQDDVNASKELTLAQHELGLSIKGAEISIGKLFIPTLTKLVGVVTRAVEWFTKLPDPVKEIGLGAALAAGAVGGLTLAFSALSKVFQPVIEGLTSVGKALVESGLFQDAAAGLSTAATGIQAVGTAAQTSGQQLQLFSDGSSATSTAIQDVGNAANVANLAITAKTGETVSFLEVAGAKIAGFFGGIGEGLAGIGSSIVAALTSPVGIIIAVTAAVAVLGIVVVKNWATIKKSLGPVGDFLSTLASDFKAAFLALGPPLVELGHSLGDLGAALGRAFGPLLPLLAPIAKVLAVIAGVALFGPLIALLKITTIGFQALAVVIRGVATAVESTANFIIRAVNAVIGQINNVIGASNKWLHTSFDLIQPVQELGAASTDTASATGDLAKATNDAADAQGRAAGAFNISSTALKSAAPLLQAMGTNFHTLATAAQTAADAATQSGGDMTAAFQTFKDQTIASAKAAWDSFKTNAQTAISFATSQLGLLEQAAQQAQQTLAGDTSSLSSADLAALHAQATITAKDILSTFKAAGNQTKQFSHDLLELSHVGGKAGKDLAASLLASGDILSAQVIADAPAKLQKQIVHSFGAQETAADQLSTKLTNAIIGPIKGITNAINALAEQVFGVTLKYNDDGAKAGIDHLTRGIAGLTNTPHEIDIILHTKTGSPWPDEALKQHLFDPLKAQGGKMINGRWTLPLDVSIHAALGDGLGIGAALLHPHPDMTVGPSDSGYLDRVLQGAPHLPRGHTDVSVNPHNTTRRALQIRLDRRHFDDELSYQTSYARGY